MPVKGRYVSVKKDVSTKMTWDEVLALAARNPQYGNHPKKPKDYHEAHRGPFEKTNGRYHY